MADWYLISVARERTISIRSMNESLANPESLGGACPDKIATFAAEEKSDNINEYDSLGDSTFEDTSACVAQNIELESSSRDTSKANSCPV